MFNWQHDNHQKKLFNPYNNELCPMKCREAVTHHHYLHCKGDNMNITQSKQSQTLHNRLERMDTHPYIIITILRYLTESPDARAKELEKSDDDLTNTVHLAWEENVHLGH